MVIETSLINVRSVKKRKENDLVLFASQVTRTSPTSWSRGGVNYGTGATTQIMAAVFA